MSDSLSHTQSQTVLFDASTQVIDIADGSLVYYPDWLALEEADKLFITLRQRVEWEQSTIQLYGKAVKIPRLNAWYGDADCPYRYSGRRFYPKPWLPALWELKQRLEKLTGCELNSVLVNCYRDGQDSVAWHSDDEPELGNNPVVVSLSLGAERVFQLRHRFDATQASQKLTLAHGSVLHMSGALQHHWQHQIPKTRRHVNERINLTYRYVIPDVAYEKPS